MRRLHLLTFSLLIGFVFCVPGAAPAHATLVGITLGGDLWHIDPQTGDELFVGATGFVGMNGLALDPVAGELLAVSTEGLVRIDPIDASSTLVGGTVFALQGLAYSPGGLLYGVRNPGSLDLGGTSGPDVLVRIDLQTGIQTDVGSLGLPFKNSVQGLSFLGDTLYGWDLRATSGLITIDPLTGIGTELPGGTDLFQDMQALGASADGSFLWGSGRGIGGGLARIDPATGDPIAVQPLFDNLYRGIEDLDRIVPEPGTGLLLGAGLLAWAWGGRRRAGRSER